MKTYLLTYKPSPALILRAKRRAKECMNRTKNPEECRVHFELVDELIKEARALGVDLMDQSLVDREDRRDM